MTDKTPEYPILNVEGIYPHPIDHLVGLVEYSSEAMVSMDSSWKILSCNRATEEMFGFTKSEAIGKTPFEMGVMEFSEEKLKDYQQQIAEKGVYITERTLFTKNQNKLICLLTVHQIKNSSGELIGMVAVTANITTQKSLIDRERQLQSYVHHSPAAIAMFDKNMNYVVASERWLTDYHLENENIIGKSHYEVFPAISDDWRAIHKRCLLGFTAKNEQELFIHPTGRKSWIRWEVKPWYSSENEIGGIILFSEDISERKAAEEIIAENEKKFRSLVERISDGFMALDKDWKFTYVNPVSEKLFNIPAEQLLGNNIWDVFPNAIDGLFYKSYQEAVNTQKPVQFVGFSRYGQKWLQTTAYPSSSGLTIYFKDVTDQKQAEEKVYKSQLRLKQAQKIAHIGHWEFDLINQALTWSDQTYAIFGLRDDKTEMDLARWLAFVHPDDLKEVGEKFRLARTNSSSFALYHRIIRKNGELRFLYSEGKHEFDPYGNPISFFGIFHDITPIKKLEQDLLEYQRLEQLKLTAAAVQAQENERSAIGTELHDNVNQILVGTKLMLSLAKTSKEKNVEIIQSAMDNIQIAINENRKIAHELVAPDFIEKSLEEQIKSLTDTMLTPASIQTVIESSDLHETLLTNQQKLAIYRAAQEQCTNIVKYAKARNTNILLRNTDGVFKMVISDDGTGMDTSKKTDGIGLRNIKSRVSLLNGTVTTRSSIGHGFTLEVNLPLSA